MLSHGLLKFGVGCVGRGSIATVAYLCGGKGTLRDAHGGLLPNCRDRNNARGSVVHVVELEGCHWLDMQQALCLWRASS